MKVTIIVFSPSGHTLKAANMFKTAFEGNGVPAQLINITKNPDFLEEDGMTQRLEHALEAHDMLLIGGPIYAGHMESNVLRLIRNLPACNGKFGTLAVPFATYGGVHSSVALDEAGRLLKKKKRKSILGVKIAAEHTLTKTASKIICEGLPGENEEKIIAEAVEKIIAAAQNPAAVKDAGKSFRYAKPMERLMFKLFSQEAIHKKFKHVAIDENVCTQCGCCVAACPVNLFEIQNGQVRIAEDRSLCILCAECYHQCPSGAIVHPYIEPAKVRLKDGNAQLEDIPSAIYGR